MVFCFAGIIMYGLFNFFPRQIWVDFRQKVCGIKVLNVEETGPIGYARAFYRDSVWILFSVAGVIFFLVNQQAGFRNIDNVVFDLDSYLGTVSLIWTILEIVSTFTNSKRRAIHDFLAASVVVDIVELENERKNFEYTGSPL